MSTLDLGPHGQTETGAAYTEAAAHVQALAEANHPARLLGVAQSAIETALRTNDLAAIHAQLAAALDRIKPEPADRYCSSPRSNHGDGRGCEDEACPKHGHSEEENAA